MYIGQTVSMKLLCIGYMLADIADKQNLHKSINTLIDPYTSVSYIGMFRSISFAFCMYVFMQIYTTGIACRSIIHRLKITQKIHVTLYAVYSVISKIH